MSLKENTKIEINHEDVSKACSLLFYKDATTRDIKKCLKILDDTFSVTSPNIYLKDKKGIQEPWTPLMICCYMQFYEGVKLLLSKGADPNMTGTDGKTCLTISVVQDKLSIIQLLLSKGAVINHQDKQGKTALMTACEAGNFDTVQLLVNNKANIKIRNNYDQDSITIGMECKKYNIVSFLEHFYLNATLGSKSDKAKTKI